MGGILFINLRVAAAEECIQLPHHHWLRDPFKAKWAIVARANSAIRDKVGKPRAPLDRFLSLVCPALDIIDIADFSE